MNCHRMENLILPYLDGRLKDGRRRDVEAHVAACEPCRLRLHEFRAVSGLLDELPAVEPSAAFDARVRARIAAEPPRQNWLAWLTPSPRVAFAASLLVLLIAWSANRPTDTDTYPFHVASAAMGAEDHIRMVKDLQVLEDFDVLANFEPLTDLPPAVQQEQN
jgi:anti-sigma factor RsiW